MWEMEERRITGSDEELINSDSQLTCIQFLNCLSACGLIGRLTYDYLFIYM